MRGDGAAEELAAELEALLGERALVLRREDILASALLGPVGAEVTERVSGRIPDLLVLSRSQRPDFLRRRPVSVADLTCDLADAAAGLRDLGVRAGDPVAIVLPNCPQHIIAFYAVLRLGAVVVEHNPLYTPRELRKQFEDHGARVAIAWDREDDPEP